LLDRGGARFTRLDWAPDGFTIRVVTSDGYQNILLNEDNKRIADLRLKKGEITVDYESPRARSNAGTGKRRRSATIGTPGTKSVAAS
jgi:hypothetical protein